MFWFGFEKLAKSSKSWVLEDNLFANVGFFYIFYTNFGERGCVLSKFCDLSKSKAGLDTDRTCYVPFGCLAKSPSIFAIIYFI